MFKEVERTLPQGRTLLTHGDRWRGPYLLTLNLSGPVREGWVMNHHRGHWIGKEVGEGSPVTSLEPSSHKVPSLILSLYAHGKVWSSLTLSPKSHINLRLFTYSGKVETRFSSVCTSESRGLSSLSLRTTLSESILRGYPESPHYRLSRSRREGVRVDDSITPAHWVSSILHKDRRVYYGCRGVREWE